MRLRKLEEKDFQVLRGPLESGRQSPKANSGTLLLAIPLAVFMYVILYVVLGWGQDFPYPYQKQILFVCFAIQVTMILSSIIFAVPVVYKRNENLQYAVFIVASQNLFTIPAYLMTIFIAAESNASNSSLLIFTFITLLLGVLVFVATCVRFSILLKKGQYRKGSKKDKSRVHLEKKSLISIGIFGGLMALYIIQYIARHFDYIQVDSIFIAVLGMGIFYTMIFVLPEQLVILYCKYRFDSFNFEPSGEIKPSRDENENMVS